MDTDIYKVISDLDKMAPDIVKLLSGLSLKLAAAESCTGGLITEIITSAPGASAVLDCGFCTYANAAKEKHLNVKRETLNLYGAVSRQTAAEMARGVRRAANSDIGISTTGIAGPGGAVPGKPVGTVFIGLSYSGAYSGAEKILSLRVSAAHIEEAHRRAYIRYETARQALILLRDFVILNL